MSSSWHDIECTEDKPKFWRQIRSPQLKGRGLLRISKSGIIQFLSSRLRNVNATAAEIRPPRRRRCIYVDRGMETAHRRKTAASDGVKNYCTPSHGVLDQSVGGQWNELMTGKKDGMCDPSSWLSLASGWVPATLGPPFWPSLQFLSYFLSPKLWEREILKSTLKLWSHFYLQRH